MTFASLSLCVCALFSSTAMAQSIVVKSEAPDAYASSPAPLLSMWNDGVGFGIQLELLAPNATTMLGEIVLGVDLQPSTVGGVVSTVVPLARMQLVLGLGGRGTVAGDIRIPRALVLSAAEFYAQGVVYGSANSSALQMTDPVPVGFEGAVASPRCVDNTSFSTNGGSNNNFQGFGGFTLLDVIEAFEDDDGNLAAAAYKELYDRGTVSIPALLDVAQKPQSIAALWSSINTWEAHESSFVRYEGGEPISVRRMALYLISAIAMGTETPYAVAELNDPSYSVVPAAQHEALALDHISTWWEANEGKPLAELLEGTRPLYGAPVDFGVPQGLLDPDLVFPVGAGLEDTMPGSSTALALGAAQIHAYAGDQTFLATATTEKKDPYNCLSWAVNCDMCSGWVQPCKPTGASIDDWMMMNGWSMTPPAGGASQTVSIQNQVDAMGNSTWVHAMKKNADCSWSSKNGAGPFYPMFDDPECFGDMHYPPPTGSTNDYTNWYK